MRVLVIWDKQSTIKSFTFKFIQSMEIERVNKDYNFNAKHKFMHKNSLKLQQIVDTNPQL